MGIDGFTFNTRTAERQFSEAPSNLCVCGRDIVNHTLKEKRACKPESKEAILAAEGAG
jgi:hypothetical protein